MKTDIAIAVLCAALMAGCSSAPKTPEVAKETKKIEPAPTQFNVKFETSKGDFVVEIHKDWAPLGVDRFYELVQDKFFDDARFFRVVKNFIVQFGINGDPKLAELWRQLKIADDPVRESNRRGTITYATAGPGTRTTQVFINLADNAMLDRQGFASFGKVTDGMSVVEHLYNGYGEEPDQSRIEMLGNEYLKSHFEKLDYIKSARVVK